MKLVLTLMVLTIASQNISAKAFKEGYYYTKEGKKVQGLIKFRRASFTLFSSKPSDILFKENEDSKSTKFTANDISSFVIGSDSFTVVYNFKINPMKGEYKEDFVQVGIIGKMNMFIHFSSSGDGKSFYDFDSYVLSKDNQHFLGIWKVKSQRKEIAQLFSNDEEIKIKILNKEFDKNIPELVKEYNSKNN